MCCGPSLSALLAACADFGTYPFAALARAAFIATTLLDDLEAEGVFTTEDRARFIAGLGLVTGELHHDFHALAPQAFLARYGHLRPGTYDILSPATTKPPPTTTSTSPPAAPHPPAQPPAFTPHPPPSWRPSKKLVEREGLDWDARQMLDFAAGAIRGREAGKFAFTAHLSAALSGIRTLGERLDVSADDLSHTDVATLTALTGERSHDTALLARAAEAGRARYARSRTLTLPPAADRRQ
ncbi:hypothetical protein GCM10020000_84690 [Streptomyces olivoverticillatus]